MERLKIKDKKLPFWVPVGSEGQNRLWHDGCSGEVTFKKGKGRYVLLGTCDRCYEDFQIDRRTLQKHFGTIKPRDIAAIRKASIKALKEPPNWLTDIEEFDVSDRPILYKWYNGASLSRNPTQKAPPIIGIFVSGKFHHIPQKKPKQLIVIRGRQRK